MNNTQVHPISHHFPVIAQYLSSCHLGQWTKIWLFNALILHNLLKCLHQSYCKKPRFFGPHFYCTHIWVCLQPLWRSCL